MSYNLKKKEGAYMSFTKYKNKHQSAFTLAEVLITLGIIGVVAAMTLPTLIASHQKQVYVTSLRKGMSVISGAFAKMQADEEASSISTITLFSDGLCVPKFKYEDGESSEVPNGCEERYGNPSIIQNLIPKYIKIVKTCTGSDCDIQYKEHWTMNCTGDKCTLPTTGDTSKLDSKWFFSFATITGFYSTDGIIYYLMPTSGAILVGIDTNGEKGPNEFGRDFFPMLYCAGDNGRLILAYNADESCGSSWIINGTTPLSYIASHGWKMDY